jgi:hypothetical protein
LSDLQQTIDIQLSQYEISFNVERNNHNSGNRLGQLIRNIHNKFSQKVVILIDEYDKPILDNIESRELALQMRNELRNFYSAIKDNDAYIKFAFLTGVSKFSKVSIFSGLNNIEDIALSPEKPLKSLDLGGIFKSLK